MNKKQGFTIIELIVVIAIIAVLASIVLVNVTSYITKGKDAAAQGNLATIMTNGAVQYDSSSNYNGWMTGASPTTAGTDCTGVAGWTGPCKALETAGYHVTNTCDTVLCAATATKWCAMVTLKGTGTPKYCVDSTGAKISSATSCVAGVCS